MIYALWVETDGRYAFSRNDNGGVPLDEAQHMALLDGQLDGKDIVPGANGFPVLQDPPSATYKQSLDKLNLSYQADVAKLNSAFALALLSDGPSEATKISAIRTQYDARKTKHAADLAALKLEYGV